MRAWTPLLSHQRSSKRSIIVSNPVWPSRPDLNPELSGEARAIQRGEHNKYVFTYLDFRGEWTRLGTLRNSGWIAARRRASVSYRDEFGKEPPKGFQRVRAHDLRHTFGRRLRAASVSLEDRQDLLGHEAGRVTTHYSSAEVANLVKAANAVKKSRESPTRTVFRLISAEG
jgi:integrase